MRKKGKSGDWLDEISEEDLEMKAIWDSLGDNKPTIQVEADSRYTVIKIFVNNSMISELNPEPINTLEQRIRDEINTRLKGYHLKELQKQRIDSILKRNWNDAKFVIYGDGY